MIQPFSHDLKNYTGVFFQIIYAALLDIASVISGKQAALNAACYLIVYYLARID